ncbi:MAG: DUF1161 domain-containing protein [Burkholderiaceae bacterium]|nr:DUF1161 domain-containing protein [Burkholderiaceae bacterium]
MAALACAQALSAASATCDELVAAIDARIRANGATGFTVAAVDLAASAPGRQVGTCDAGRKKIMYERGTQDAAASQAGAGTRATRPRVITECADGRVIEEGTCEKK